MKNSILILATLGLGFAATQVYAEPEVVSADVDETSVLTSDDSTAGLNETFANAVSDAALSDYRGGAEVVHNTNNVNGQLYDNSAIGNITGHNFVTDNAFANASGLSTVIQNSGNNVLIQNATILNLQLQ